MVSRPWPMLPQNLRNPGRCGWSLSSGAGYVKRLALIYLGFLMCLISLGGCHASRGMASSPDGNDNGVCCEHSSVSTPSQRDLILRWRLMNPGRDGALGWLGTLHIWGDAGRTGQPLASNAHKPRSPSPGPAGRGPAAGTWIDGLSSAEPTQSRASRSSSGYALRNPYEVFD